MVPDTTSRTDRRPSTPGAWAAGGDTPLAARPEPPEPPPPTSPAADLLIGLTVALFGGALGVLGALVQQMSTDSLAMAVSVAPAVEEIMKPIALVFLIERAPHRIQSRLQIVLTALAAGLFFSIVENLIYIHVYFGLGRQVPGPEAELLRWVACTPLHMICSTIVGIGLAREWAHYRRTGERVEIERIFPWFAAAVILHASWNAIAMITS